MTLLMILAGEPSGDALGGAIMAALKRVSRGSVRFAGIGGERMAAQGLDSLFPMEDLSVMGLTEVLPRLPLLLRRIREAAHAALGLRPAAVITIDAPDFSFRVAKRLARSGIPLIHVVAPSVWAWRPGRARKIARLYGHLLALLPFEPPFFEAEGLACSFVGHPVVEGGADRGDGAGFRVRHGIAPGAPLLCVLPGSRGGEVRRLLAPFGETVARLIRRFPDLRVVVPTLSAVAAPVTEAVASWPGRPIVVQAAAEKYGAFAASQAALAASGTVSLELALAGLAHIIAYRVHPVTAWLLRRLLKIRQANLINLVEDKRVIPEFLQEDCIPENLETELAALLSDPHLRQDRIAAAGAAMRKLGKGGPAPAERAARIILREIGWKESTDAGDPTAAYHDPGVRPGKVP